MIAINSELGFELLEPLMQSYELPVGDADGAGGVGSRYAHRARWDASDPAATAACHEVTAAAGVADDPLGPPVTARRMSSWFEHPAEPRDLVRPGATAAV